MTVDWSRLWMPGPRRLPMLSYSRGWLAVCRLWWAICPGRWTEADVRLIRAQVRELRLKAGPDGLGARADLLREMMS